MKVCQFNDFEIWNRIRNVKCFVDMCFTGTCWCWDSYLRLDCCLFCGIHSQHNITQLNTTQRKREEDKLNSIQIDSLIRKILESNWRRTYLRSLFWRRTLTKRSNIFHSFSWKETRESHKDPLCLEAKQHFLGSLTIAYMPSLNRIVHMEQVGEMEIEKTFQGIDLCVDACKQIHKIMIKHLTMSLLKKKQKNNKKWSEVRYHAKMDGEVVTNCWLGFCLGRSQLLFCSLSSSTIPQLDSLFIE